MYTFYLDGWQFPQTPEKLTVNIKGKNKTLTLVNDGEINFLKTPGLTEISFDAPFPMLGPYSFTASTFQRPDYYLSKLEALMTGKKASQFIVSRVTPAGKLLYSTNIKVSVEEYSVVEKATNGLDLTVTIKLKQCPAFSTKTVKVTYTAKKVATTSTASTSTAATSSTSAKLKAGDMVRINKGAKSYNGVTMCSFVFNGTYRVDQVGTTGKPDYIVVDKKGICTAFHEKDLTLVSSAKTVSTTSSRSTESAPSTKTYKVVKGDTLWGIAKKYYGNGAQYNKIYNANKDKIKNPNLIYVGQVLTIP